MTPPLGVGQALGESARPLADVHDVALLDLDGVLYVGPDPVPHAAEALAAARERGLSTAYVTNNASRPPSVVAGQLRDLGIPAADADVVTSAQAAARVLAEHLAPGDPVLVVGTDALAAEVRARGLTVVERSDDRPRAVVQGFDPHLRWSDLAEAAYALADGALWVASNTDASVPTPRGRAPGNGAFVAALATATRRAPLVAGKPEPALHLESVERTGARRPLVVGDRLDTDVLGAVRAGCASLLVLTGVTDVAHLLAALPGERPTHVGPDLRALVLPQPPVATTDGGWVCDGWRVTRGGGRLTVHGSAEVRAAHDGTDPQGPVRDTGLRDTGLRDTGLRDTAHPHDHTPRDTPHADGGDADAAARADVAVLRALCAASWTDEAGPVTGVGAGDPAAADVLARLRVDV